MEYKGDIKLRVEGLEHIMKATLVGQTLPLLASVVSSEKCLRLPTAKSFLPAVINVTVTATRVRRKAKILYLKRFKQCLSVEIGSVPLCSNVYKWFTVLSALISHPHCPNRCCCHTRLSVQFEPTGS